MATFPSTLPLPLSSGYGVSPIDPVIRSEMEIGPARARRTTLADNDKVSVRWVMNDEQLETFRLWFKGDAAGDAAGGAAWFAIKLHLGIGGAKIVSARFTKVFEFSQIEPNMWNVTGSLETRDA